jgi:hypothetical protein
LLFVGCFPGAAEDTSDLAERAIHKVAGAAAPKPEAGAAPKAEGVVARAVESVKHTAESVKHTAESVVESVKHTAESAVSGVKHGVESAVETVKHKAHDLGIGKETPVLTLTHLKLLPPLSFHLIVALCRVVFA